MLALVESQLILKSLMIAPSDEVYLLDKSTLQCLYASDVAIARLGCDIDAMTPDVLESALGLSQQALLSPNIDVLDVKRTRFLDVHKSLTSTLANNNQLRVMLIQSGDNEYIFVTKSDFSSNEKVVMALTESESRFQAIVSNIPGLVFQLQMHPDQSLHFVYLSDGCEALLGMTIEELQEDAEQLMSIMNARDRSELRAKLMESAESREKLDWEGRVWIDGWQDTKWINLRATTRELDNGTVQWDGMMINITQSKLEKLEIEQSRRDLAQLTAHMNHIKEQERINIAREIHDDLGGNLTAIKMGLASMAKQMSAGQAISEEQTLNLESIVNRTFESVHRISGNLRPNILDLGIVDALDWQLNQYKKQLNLACKFTANQSEIDLSTDQSMTLFRICQEALSNIAKYAKATAVTVDIKVVQHDVILTIIDNGVGISDIDKMKSNSFGLRGMQERVCALHGSLEITKPEHLPSGTKIVAIIPI